MSQEFGIKEREKPRKREKYKSDKGKILPEDLRKDLRESLEDLGYNQQTLAKEANVSKGLVSNLFTGAQSTRSAQHVARLTSVLERRIQDQIGHLEEKKLNKITTTIESIKTIYGIVPKPFEGLGGIMIDSIRMIIEQQALLTQSLANVSVNSYALLEEEFSTAVRFNGTLSRTTLILLQDLHRGDLISSPDKLK